MNHILFTFRMKRHQNWYFTYLDTGCLQVLNWGPVELKMQTEHYHKIESKYNYGRNACLWKPRNTAAEYLTDFWHFSHSI